MSPARIPGALLEKLGPHASSELMEVLDARQRASTEIVMTQSEDRFERRLIEETSQLRVDTARVRGELQQGFAQVRGELKQGFADTRVEIAEKRFELLKWSFAFWVAQLVGVAGIVGVLLRTLSPR